MSVLDKWHLDFFDCNHFTFSAVTQAHHTYSYIIYVTNMDVSQMNSYLLCGMPSDNGMFYLIVSLKYIPVTIQ